MTTITHPQLVAALVKPPQAILDTLTIYNIDLWHGATGVAGEAGELLEAILYPPAEGFDRVNLREELGDLYFYIEQILQRTGININRESIYEMASHLEISGGMDIRHAGAIAVHGSQVLDTIKKAAIYNKQLDTELLANQLQALLVAMGALGLMFGLSVDECLAANIVKLSKRYASLQYSDQQAQDRADKVQPADGVIPDRKPFKGEPLDLPPEITAEVDRGYDAAVENPPVVPAMTEDTDPIVLGDKDAFTEETAIQFYKDYGRPPQGWEIERSIAGDVAAVRVQFD